MVGQGASYGLKILTAISVLFVCLSLALYAAGVRINLSASHPPGLYRLVGQDPAVGLYAIFCVPVPLADLPPLDQTRVPPCTRDRPGYPVLKRIARIEAGGDIHVRGDHPLSLDSRIFGPLRAEDITGVAVRVGGF
ncbi:hypothetical protein [Ruegeria sp.]|uniref:hypothetical protein n=1 Tax=Ruegeria sp. TaxID=1879320 RepID=UPI003B005267